MKKIISSLLALTSILSSATTYASAVNNEEIQKIDEPMAISSGLGDLKVYNGGDKYTYLRVDGVNKTQTYAYYYLDDGKEVPVYCINPNTPGVSEVVDKGEYVIYSAEELYNDPKIVGIVSNGYPHKTLYELNLDTPEQAYYATKTALWCYLLSHWSIDSLSINTSLSTEEQEVSQRILEATKKIYDWGSTWTSIPQVGLIATADQPTAYAMNIGGVNYYGQVYTVSSNTFVSGYDIFVSMQDTANTPAGTRIVDMDNNDITSFQVSTDSTRTGQFKVLFPADSIVGETASVKLNFDSVVYKYEVYLGINQETSKYGTLQNYMCDSEATQSYSASTYATYTTTEDEEIGLNIIKVSKGTNTPLAGAVFEIIDPTGANLGTYVTDGNGKINVPIDIEGLYVVTEIVPPEWHLLDGDITQTVNVKFGDVAVVTFANSSYGDLRINKIDADTGENLTGAVIQITHIESGTVYTETTDFSGLALFESLLPGAYEVKEIVAPVGYFLDDSSYNINVVEQDVTSFSITNQAKPGLKIVKLDSETREQISNVIFEVFLDTVSLGHFKTNEFGEINLLDVEAGTYKIVEVEAKEGYILDETPKEIEIFSTDKIKEIIFLNSRKPSLEITKVDSITSSPIKNTQFEIWWANSLDGTYKNIGTYYTDVNGKIELTDLDEGFYKVEETKPADGYVMDENSSRTVYLQANKSVSLTFENTPLNALVINKVSTTTGEPLAGAKFRLRYFEGVTGTGGTVIGEYETSVNGTIIVTGLEAGTYIVEETQAPDGYIIDTTPQTIYISDNEQAVVTVEFRNQPDSGLIITKMDAITFEPLADTTFLVTTDDGTVVGEDDGIYITDERGIIHIPNLPTDTYVVTEMKAPEGYILDTIPQTVKLIHGETHSLFFYNQPDSGLIITKLDSVTKEPLAGAIFKVTTDDGTVVGDDNGYYTTDVTGVIHIPNIVTDTYIVSEISAPDGYILDATPQTVKLIHGETHSLTFFNTPLESGTLKITKVDSSSGEVISGVTFSLCKINGERIGTYITDSNGEIYIEGLDVGSYTVQEIKTVDGYFLDDTIYNVEIKNNEVTTLRVSNSQMSGLLIWKVDADSYEGLYGAMFIVYDSKGNPIGEYSTDNRGCIYISDLASGTYKIREIQAPEGYQLDTVPKTVTVKYGSSTEVVWENSAIKGQIQIVKKSADYNSMNGLPAGSLLANATYEIYNRAGTKVDTIVTDNNGFASSQALPLGTYTIKETIAPSNYVLDTTEYTVMIEHSGQIVRVELTNKSLVKGVAIQKYGVSEVVSNQPMHYYFTGISNTGNTSLENFYFKDTLPNEVTLNAIETGTFSQAGTYKIVYRVNNGSYVTLADNLSTLQNYTIDTSATALGLRNDEKITEIMYVFGIVPSGFQTTSSPKLHCTTASWLIGGTSYVNIAEVGGTYNGEWVQAVSRVVTSVYGQSKLPQTGY